MLDDKELIVDKVVLINKDPYGEGRVNGTKFTPNGFALRFYQLRVQHALMTYTLLPVRIKTSNIDAAQLARRNPGDPRRRTGDPQDPLM